MHWTKYCWYKCTPNAKIIQTSDKEESEIEFKIEDVHFDLFLWQLRSQIKTLLKK